MTAAIHCLSCKTKTPTTGARKVRTSNGRTRIAGTCAKCGKKKSQMVGGGWFSSLAKGALKLVAPVALDAGANFLKNKIAGSGVRRKRRGGALY